MVGVTAKPQIKDAVRARVTAGKCLIAGCDCKVVKRGLCNAHYLAFRRESMNRPRKDRAEFEAAAIREGRILAVSEARQIRRPNPFADL